MTRSTSDILSIITDLKSYQDTRDDLFNKAHTKLVASDSINALRLLSLKHDGSFVEGTDLCVHCQIKYDDNNNVVGVLHTAFSINDKLIDMVDGVATLQQGLTSLLIDEDYTITPSETINALY